MAKFTVVYVKGKTVGTGSYTRFEPLTGKTLYSVETPDRASAYVNAYEHLAKLGLDVFPFRDPDSHGNPLGFSDREVKAVNEAEVPFESEPLSGIRIEQIWE